MSAIPVLTPTTRRAENNLVDERSPKRIRSSAPLQLVPSVSAPSSSSSITSVSDLLVMQFPILASMYPYPQHASDMLLVTCADRRFIVSCESSDIADNCERVLRELRGHIAVKQNVDYREDESTHVLKFNFNIDILDLWQFDRTDRHAGSRAWKMHADVRKLACAAPLTVTLTFTHKKRTTSVSPSLSHPNVRDTQVLNDYIFGLSQSAGLTTGYLAELLETVVIKRGVDLVHSFREAYEGDLSWEGNLGREYKPSSEQSIKEALFKKASRGEAYLILLKDDIHYADPVIPLQHGGVAFVIDEKIARQGPWLLVGNKDIVRPGPPSADVDVTLKSVEYILDAWPTPTLPKFVSLSHIKFESSILVFRLDGRLNMTFKDTVVAPAVARSAFRKIKDESRAVEDTLDPEDDADIVNSPSIPLLILFGRTSDEGGREYRPTTLARQILSSAANPPTWIRRDFSNVKEIRIVGELCSSSQHAAADRSVFKMLFENVPVGTIILVSNPDRLGRRPEDRTYVRDAALKAGVAIFVQGIKDAVTADNEDIKEEDGDNTDLTVEEQTEETEEVKDTEAPANSLLKWRDFNGEDKSLIDEGLQNALVYAHEVGFYAGSTAILDRVMYREPASLVHLQTWLLSLCRARNIKKLVVLARTSSPSKNSISRQTAFGTLLAGKAQEAGFDVSKIVLEDVSVWLECKTAIALDSPAYEDALVVGSSIDRFARNQEGYASVLKVAESRRQVWIANLWPIHALRQILAVDDERASAPTTSDPVLSLAAKQAYTSILSMEQCNTYPVLIPMIIAGEGYAPYSSISEGRVKAAEGFVRGMLSSSYQGTGVVIPPRIINAKSMSNTFGNEIAALFKERHLAEDMEIQVTGQVARPRGGYTGDLWICRCQADAKNHTASCRCKCTTCRSIDDRACPSRFTGVCPPLCPCTCKVHHKEGSSIGTSTLQTAELTSSTAVDTATIPQMGQTSLPAGQYHLPATLALPLPAILATIPPSSGTGALSTSSTPTAAGKACLGCRRTFTGRGGRCGSCKNKATKAKKAAAVAEAGSASTAPTCGNILTVNGGVCGKVASIRPKGEPAGTPLVCKPCCKLAFLQTLDFDAGLTDQ